SPDAGAVKRMRSDEPFCQEGASSTAAPPLGKKTGAARHATNDRNRGGCCLPATAATSRTRPAVPCYQAVPDQLCPDQPPDQLCPDQLCPDQLSPDQLSPDQL